MPHRLAILCSLAAVTTTSAYALPPDEHGRGFVEGANHHVGDAGFIAAFGRVPSAGDAEALRMHTHLAWIRAELGKRPATRPELAARRAQILATLDDYIARGTTPMNVALPWRNPVFIDPLGQICAVGYLIERDAVAGGRAVAEAIAAAHRFDYLEDIAAAMPEVAAWIDGSGFTLEELASIQPGYMRPMLDGWLLEKKGKVDLDGIVQTDLGGKVVGGGDLTRGSGRWKSYYGSGKLLAEGDYRGGRATGAWRIYHESGRLAAEGRFARGTPSGAWTFYADDDAHTRLSRGAVGGARWTHFGPDDQPLATSYRVKRAGDWTSGGEYVLDFRYPSDRAVRVRVHEGNVGGDYVALSLIDVDGLRLAARYQWDADPELWDGRGRGVSRAEGGGWTRTTCRDAGRARLAKSGDIIGAHDLAEPSACATEAVPAGDAARLERWWAVYQATQPPAPAHLDHLRSIAISARDRRAGHDAEPAADDVAAEITDVDDDAPADPAQHGVVSRDGRGWLELLAGSMTWYVEPAHVDSLFELLYATMPDRCYREAADSCEGEAY